DQFLQLDDASQLVSFSTLHLERSGLRVGSSGPASIRLTNSALYDFDLRVENDCEVYLGVCNLILFRATLAPGARLVLDRCLYDPNTCSLPSAQALDLRNCESSSLMEHLSATWALVEVLRRLVVLGARPELTKRKTNVNSHYLFNGI